MIILSVDPWYTFEFQLQAQESYHTREKRMKSMWIIVLRFLSNNDKVDTNQTL